jgi:hypothetical protein
MIHSSTPGAPLAFWTIAHLVAVGAHVRTSGLINMKEMIILCRTGCGGRGLYSILITRWQAAIDGVGKLRTSI